RLPFRQQFVAGERAGQARRVVADAHPRRHRLAQHHLPVRPACRQPACHGEGRDLDTAGKRRGRHGDEAGRQ
ncbi:conserved hypothetical protein, partial [Ricinus communis]